MQGDADQAALAGRVDRDGRERRRQQRAVLDDAQRPALLGDEEPPVGRLRERGRARQADDPALVAREAARLRRRCRRSGPARVDHGETLPEVSVARARSTCWPRGIEAGVERRRIRRARVGGADRDAVDLELDARDGDVVGRRRGDGDRAGEAAREVRRRASARPSAVVPSTGGGRRRNDEHRRGGARRRRRRARRSRARSAQCAPALVGCPRERVRARRVLAEQRAAVEELDLGDAVVGVSGGRGQADRGWRTRSRSTARA